MDGRACGADGGVFILYMSMVGTILGTYKYIRIRLYLDNVIFMVLIKKVVIDLELNSVVFFLACYRFLNKKKKSWTFPRVYFLIDLKTKNDFWNRKSRIPEAASTRRSSMSFNFLLGLRRTRQYTDDHLLFLVGHFLLHMKK